MMIITRRDDGTVTETQTFHRQQRSQYVIIQDKIWTSAIKCPQNLNGESNYPEFVGILEAEILVSSSFSLTEYRC